MTDLEKLLAEARKGYMTVYSFEGRQPRAHVRTSLSETAAAHELEDLAPSLAAALLVAKKALRAYDAYEAVPADRGGKTGPKGKAWQAFLDAKAAALSEIEKLTGGGE